MSSHCSASACYLREQMYMLTNPQAMTFQKINIAVYHQHKSDKIDHEILQYHLRGKCVK